MNPCPVFFRLRSLAVSLALIAAAFSAATAEVGIQQGFPLPRVRMKNGLTVEVDTRGVSSNGYRSIRIKIINTPSRTKPPVPVTADRRFRVVIEPRGMGHMSQVKTSQVIEIPEKQASGEGTIAIPTSGDWYDLKVWVYEGGELLEDVSGAMAAGFFGLRNDSESLPALLFVDYDVPDRATRDTQMVLATTRPGAVKDTFNLPDYSNLILNIPYTNLGMAAVTQPSASVVGKRLTDAQVLALTAQQGKVQLLPPAELPAKWIELSCYDIAFISLDDLARMTKDHPRQRRALVDWLHGGPALVVYGAGEKFERLGELEQFLELRPLPAAAQENEVLRGWTRASSAESGREIYSDPSRRGYYGTATVESAGLPPANSTPQKPLWIHRPTVSIVGRPAGFGWVTAIKDSDPFPAESADWKWVLQSIPTRHQVWSTRHGMTYMSYNEGIWNWYVPGVGAAPVFSFLLLATLFAVVIGPVNYLLLGKINRLYLLLVTVPVGAMVVTLCLFAYAVLSDGLGVKSRIRSFTMLDQKTGRSASWSRQSYYASLVPSQGLLYPHDTVVWPLDEKPVYNRMGPARQLNWEPEGQRLRSGFLSSRRLTQFMVTRSGRTKSKLNVAQKDGSPPVVTNQLGGTIEQLYLCDWQGKFFRAESPLAPQKSQALVPVTSAADMQEWLKQVVDGHAKDYPEGYDQVAERRRTEAPWHRSYWGSSTSASLESSLLEFNIYSLRSGDERNVQPGTYVAVMERNPDVPLGVANSEEAASFHVVVGRW